MRAVSGGMVVSGGSSQGGDLLTGHVYLVAGWAWVGRSVFEVEDRLGVRLVF